MTEQSSTSRQGPLPGQDVCSAVGPGPRWPVWVEAGPWSLQSEGSIPQAWTLSRNSLGSLGSCLQHPSLHPALPSHSEATPPQPISLRGALQPKEPFLCSSFYSSRTLFSVPRGVG